MKNNLKTLMLLSFLTITGCGSIECNPKEKPADLKIKYWLNDILSNSELSSMKLIDQADGFDSYLDSDYLFEDSLPKEYVIYQIQNKIETNEIIGIIITDPRITIYGLTTNSNEKDIKSTMKKRGFSFKEYYGRDPTYVKGDVEFCFTSETIVVSYLSTQ